MLADQLEAEAVPVEPPRRRQVGDRHRHVVEPRLRRAAPAAASAAASEGDEIHLVAQVALDVLQPGAVRVEEERDAHVARARRAGGDSTVTPAYSSRRDLPVDVGDLHTDVPDAALQVVVDPLADGAVRADLGQLDLAEPTETLPVEYPVKPSRSR